MIKRTKIKLFVWLFISFLGGVAMYCIGENEYPWQMLDDPYLLPNLGYSVASVSVYTLFTYCSMFFVHLFIQTWHSFAGYAIRRLLFQLLFSAVPAIMIAVLMASLFAYGKWAVPLWETSYFKLDIYFVLMGTGLIQLAFYILDLIIFFFRAYVASGRSYEDMSFDSFVLLDMEYSNTADKVDEQRLIQVGDPTERLEGALKKYGIMMEDVRYIPYKK